MVVRPGVTKRGAMDSAKELCGRAPTSVAWVVEENNAVATNTTSTRFMVAEICDSNAPLRRIFVLNHNPRQNCHDVSGRGSALIPQN